MNDLEWARVKKLGAERFREKGGATLEKIEAVTRPNLTYSPTEKVEIYATNDQSGIMWIVQVIREEPLLSILSGKGRIYGLEVSSHGAKATAMPGDTIYLRPGTTKRFGNRVMLYKVEDQDQALGVLGILCNVVDGDDGYWEIERDGGKERFSRKEWKECHDIVLVKPA